MITEEQIKKIHTLLSKHSVSDDLYRDILEENYDTRSCKYLTEDQASDLIQKLIDLTGDNYERLKNAQLKYNEEKWSITGEKLKKVIEDLCEMLPKREILKIFLNKTTVEQNKHIIRELVNKAGEA